MGYIASCVLSHHEKYDGTGYPFGLKQDDIPLLSRILALADAYESMTGVRPYRAPMEKEEVLREILSQSGKQFDPAVVQVFVEKIIGEYTASML